MPRGKVKVQTTVVAWWLGGEEQCPQCGQLYAYELEFRCPECDSAGCLHCRTLHADGHHVCLGCVEITEEDAHG